MITNCKYSILHHFYMTPIISHSVLIVEWSVGLSQNVDLRLILYSSGGLIQNTVWPWNEMDSADWNGGFRDEEVYWHLQSPRVTQWVSLRHCSVSQQPKRRPLKQYHLFTAVSMSHLIKRGVLSFTLHYALRKHAHKFLDHTHPAQNMTSPLNPCWVVMFDVSMWTKRGNIFESG